MALWPCMFKELWENMRKSIDYSFLITIGGIGGLVAVACALFGMALGMVTTGYFLAAVALLITAAVVARNLYVVSEAPAPLSTPVAAQYQPQVVTSQTGEMITCNMPYRAFVRDNIKRDILPPTDLMADGQAASVKEILSSLEKTAAQTHVVQLICGDESRKYIEVALCRKGGDEDYIQWTFSGAMSDVPSQAGIQGEILGVAGLDLVHLGRFLDQGDCGLMAVSAAGQITFANEVLQDWMRGYAKAELALPRPLADFCALTSSELNGQIQIHTLSGEDIHLDFRPCEALTDSRLGSGLDAPNIFQVFSCQPDMAIKDSGTENINLDRFFRESPIGIAIVTEQGDVLEKNKIFREYVKKLEINDPRNLTHIIDPDEYGEFYDRIKATLSSGLASSIADIGFRGKGEKHGHIYITRLNRLDDHDKVAILYLIDTTEQKNLELQFAQSQKMQAVGQLAGGIAHDFNNLLTAIIGFSDLLLMRHGPGDQSFSDISQIKQNANRAANLVRQLLAFSRQQTLRPKVLVITDVLAELSNLLERLIGDNIALEMTHGRNIGQVKVDQGQLEQVIINLCVNARDAMDNQGKISIRTRNISLKESKELSARYQVMPPNDYVLLEVSDTGCGIAKEHMGKIFEPFFSTKEVGKGTGLGLSTVYGIVKQTDGFVFPTSEVGKGTTFSIYLPTYQEARKEMVEEIAIAPEQPTRDLTGKGTILLVEDEDAVRMFASRALKNKGYNVHEANSGEAAFELFEKIEDELDLVISDVVMPIMDGPTLVRKIRETNQKLKVIFISGYAEDAFDKTPGDDDFNFLPKPFSLKQLAEQVKEVLEKT